MSTKKEMVAREVAKAVGAGKAVALETVDFSDPNRPKTCLEVDFPILPVNQVASIEGNAGKPIYQMSKWWARRRSSVFRSMLIAAATKAPDDPAKAAKLVWDNYYANHQKKGAFKHLKVADIFMGGGTTLVEGSRLGMQMYGNDLNPVAWFVVKQEFAKVDIEEVKRLLADIEAEVKPQIMPFYYCDGPNGEKGKWTHVPTGRVEGTDFDPLSLTPDQRKDYTYEGPEIVYTFWAKHGTCQVTGCGHRTPIVSSPVLAIKTLTIKHWPCVCKTCHANFDVEEKEARMAPDAPLYVAPSEGAFTVLNPRQHIACPQCGETHKASLGKSSKKKVALSLLASPAWVEGCSSQDDEGRPFGGSAQDDAESTIRWFERRATEFSLIEVRGELPSEVLCPDTGVLFSSKMSTVPKKSNFACANCGTVQDVLESTAKTLKSAAYQPIAIQGRSTTHEANGAPYGRRYFQPYGNVQQLAAAELEWEARRNTDLKGYWPEEELPYGLEADFWSVRRHGYTHWHTMFNHRQLLSLAILGKAIAATRGKYADAAVELVVAGFQQYIRNQCMMTVWNLSADKLEPQFAKNNFRPKAMAIENNFFCDDGRGNWTSSSEKLIQTLDWAQSPWELVANEAIDVPGTSGKSEKVYPGDPIAEPVNVSCVSSTDLSHLADASLDLCITDPPFGDLMQYAEWSDFFYVWLKPLLREKYHNLFGGAATPRDLEVVSNKARNPEDPDAFYRRLLTSCWREVGKKLKAGGLLAFTFHHSQDGPWVDVLDSLFEAGFILEATFPVRGDETKGDGQYGSQKVEYDIIHVCRKRDTEPKPVSWGRMRREVLADVAQIQSMLENHAKEGLPAADLQVIKRGKALEYFSRHYGKVFKSDGELITVKEALVGINQILDEDSSRTTNPPPVTAEPMTRQFLRIFDGVTEVPRDQMQKFMRGTGSAPDEFQHRGWCSEKKKVFTLVDPVTFVRDWQGKHRRKLTSDLDQALVLIGACVDGSGINAADTLKNANFKPHPALKDLLDWFTRRGANQTTRQAAVRALTIYNGWAATHQTEIKQMSFFFDGEEAA